jgi:hypothetical protein
MHLRREVLVVDPAESGDGSRGGVLAGMDSVVRYRRDWQMARLSARNGINDCGLVFFGRANFGAPTRAATLCAHFRQI